MTDEPRKVYLATAGEYSDYRVKHVFARKEDAEAYKLGDEVEEYVLHEGPVEVRYWHTLEWRSWMPEGEASDFQAANPCKEIELRDFDGREKHVEHRWQPYGEDHVRLFLGGWDPAVVRKVFSEQRAKYLAGQAGI